MPYPSYTDLSAFTQAQRLQLEQLVSSLQTWLQTQHAQNGSHAAVTADSVTATGNLVADSDGRLPVTVGPFGSGISAGGLGDAGVNIGGKWYVRAQASAAPGGGQDYELQFWDLTNSNNAAAIRLVFSAGGWTLMHGTGNTKPLRIGTNSRRIDEINVLTANVIAECQSTAGYKERARPTPLGEWQSYTPSWGGSTSNGTIGNGSLAGRYTQIGTTVLFELALTIGATSTIATGVWNFSLPVPKRNDAFVNVGLGGWFGGRSGVNFYQSSVFYDTTKVFPILANNPLGQVTNTSPLAWSQNDVLMLSGSYEMA